MRMLLRSGRLNPITVLRSNGLGKFCASAYSAGSAASSRGATAPADAELPPRSWGRNIAAPYQEERRVGPERTMLAQDPAGAGRAGAGGAGWGSNAGRRRESR